MKIQNLTENCVITPPIYINVSHTFMPNFMTTARKFPHIRAIIVEIEEYDIKNVCMKFKN